MVPVAVAPSAVTGSVQFEIVEAGQVTAKVALQAGDSPPFTPVQVQLQSLVYAKVPDVQ
jgi:hypothetical protein